MLLIYEADILINNIYASHGIPYVNLIKLE